ncbi:MAG: SagB/ThcOx family dehydrogenase [Candidatus Pacebacteria bacterium]|nr:SagB/ThcOx family dehydrogenase [Candidatus Paceibacterota bacterium]
MEHDQPASLHRFVRSLRKGFSSAPENKVLPVTTEKRYERMPQLQLPAPDVITTGLTDVILERQSLSGKDAKMQPLSLPLQTCSNLLGNAVAARGYHKRGYPSGGGLTPIELYLVGTLEGSATPMVYHYAPTIHTLEALWPVTAPTMAQLINTERSTRGSHVIILTARWGQATQKYRGFSYYLALLEAGHLAQNLLLCATALAVPARPIGGFDDALATSLLDLHERGEDALYVITFSPKNG